MTAGPHEQRLMTWQAVDTGRLVLISVTTILVVVSIARTAAGVPHGEGVVAIGFGLFIAFGELLRLSLPGGREAAPIAMTAALAYAMALRIARPHHLPMHSAGAFQVIAVTAIGMALGALPRIAAGRPVGLTGMSVRLLAVAAVAAIFRQIPESRMLVTDRGADFVAMAVLAALGWLIETVISGVIRADDLRARFSVTLSDEMKVQWRLGLAVGVSAIITVFGAECMGLMELIVFAGPLVVIWVAFRRYAGIRATYLQTVRALAQVTEVGGYVQSGHARRVTTLALAAGRELGMPEADLLNLEYAALMHDIGQLSLVEPIPGGATVLVSVADARRIAELGAQVIRQTGVLDTVAELVRCQWMPAVGGRREPPMGSRIIRAASAFDDVVSGSPDRDRITTALGRLRTEAGTEYDSAVVAALASAVGRLPASKLQ
jgi:HD domain